jgi:RNase P/RNase MRP subunit POP5
MKLKIKPSDKIKRRYLLLEAKSKTEVEKVILDYIGILGWAKASPLFVSDSEKVILAIERKSLTDVRAAFELSPAKIKVLRVSGTLKGLGSSK